MGLLVNWLGPHHLSLLRHHVVPGTFQIDPRSARELLDYRLNGLAIVFLDVRRPEEFGAGCVPGAINVPDSKLSPELIITMQKAPAVIVYGDSPEDAIAIELAARLRELGMSHSVSLSGGWRAWLSVGAAP